MMQQMVQPASGATHQQAVQMQQPLLYQQHQQWVAPQQLCVLVPAGSAGVPQDSAVLYAAPSGVVNSPLMQADAPQFGSSAYSSSSGAGPTGWMPAPQAVGVLAGTRPLRPLPVVDPPGLMQPPAGALDGVVQAPQTPVVLAPPQLLGPGPVLNPPRVLQPPDVVVIITPMRAAAPRLGGSAYGSSSTGPTACAPTPLVPGVLAPPQFLGLGPIPDPPGILQPPTVTVNSSHVQAYAVHPGGCSSAAAYSSNTGATAWVPAPQVPGVLAPPRPLGPGPVQDPPGILQPPAVVVNSTSMQALAPRLGGSACSSSSNADPTACALTPEVSGLLAAPQRMGPTPVPKKKYSNSDMLAIYNRMTLPQLTATPCWSTDPSELSGLLAAPQPMGPGPMLDPPGIQQLPAVAVNSAPMQADAPLFGGPAYYSSSADPTACAPTPQAPGVLAPRQALGPVPMLDPPATLQPPAGALNGVMGGPFGVQVQQSAGGYAGGIQPQHSCVQGTPQQQLAPLSAWGHLPAVQAAKPASARLLTKMLTDATSPEQLLQLVQQDEPLNPIQLSAAYTGAVRVCGCGAGAATEQQAAMIAAAAASGAVKQQLLSELHKLAERLQEQCGVGVLANIIWSCSKLDSPATAKLLLPHFLQASTLQQATAKQVSNALWAMASMGQQVTPQQLQQVLDRLVEVLPDAKPAVVSKVLWAAARLGQQVLLPQLLRLLGKLVAALPDAEPQDVSSTLWAVASMRQQVPSQQLQQLWERLVAMLPDAKPQDLSNTLWAVATMGHQVSAQQLQRLLAAFGKQLAAAQIQDFSNLLWACGKLRYLPLQLLQSLQQDPQQLQQLLAAAKPQELADMAWACGELGYAGQLPEALLQQAVLLQQVGGTGCLTFQQLCILCWSAAVLDLQQCVPQVLQLAAAASQLFSTASNHNWQLDQVHLWLLDSQLPTPNQGLASALTQQQLEQCRASCVLRLFSFANRQLSHRQKPVFDAALQLPPGTWQQQPQSRQFTKDKAHLLDISALTASGVHVAFEVEAPNHYVQPSNTLSGPTLFKHRALAARGYAVVSIPYWDWDVLHSTEQQQQYLRTKLSNLQDRGDVAVPSRVGEHFLVSCWGHLDSPSC